MLKLSKKETWHLVISILLLSLIFGFNDGAETFIYSKWFTNLIGVTLMVAFIVLFRELIVKWFAKRHDTQSEYSLWNIQRLWFHPKAKLIKPTPIGLVVALIITVVSNGAGFFTAIG